MKFMHKLKVISTYTLTLGLLISPSLSFGQTELRKLEEVRDRIVFPELTPEEKLGLTNQAQIFLRDLYVNRYSKLEYYDNALDPVPAIEEVKNNLNSLSTTELEESIYSIFVAQRDLHLNYIFPSPHGDYRSFLPLTFTRTLDSLSNRAPLSFTPTKILRNERFSQLKEARVLESSKVRVQSINPDIFAEFAPDQKVPAVGDVVLKYNNLPIRKAVEEQIKTAQGANASGGYTRALGQMTFVSHLLHLVPEENAVEIVLLASGNGDLPKGKIYKITLPWITEVPVAAELERFSVPGSVNKLSRDDFTHSEDLWQVEFNRFLAATNLEPRSDYPSNPSNDSTINWGVIENQFGTFGYLQLTSFIPELPVGAAIDEIRRLIFENFSETDGLIIDVRNNGGGNIIYADLLSQLFMAGEAKAINARLLNTDLNRRIFNETLLGVFSNPEFTDVINEVEGTGRLFSDTAPFTYDEDANRLGQAYYKPVAVLTNGRSYSATDLFSCAMQDNEAGFIYGEDPRTGAGGANVITHELFNTVLPEVFEPLPLNHAMRVSWRQSIRFGANEGKTIEDLGCKANYNVSLSTDDIINGNTTQMSRITRDLAVRARRSLASVSTEATSLNISVFPGESFALDLKVAATPKIEVYVDGELVKTVPGNRSRREKVISVTLDDVLVAGSQSVAIRGMGFFGRKPLWNIKRQVTFFSEKVSVGEDGYVLNFESNSVDPMVVLNIGDAVNGWYVDSAALQVGNNPTYVDNVNTDAVLLTDLTALSSATLSAQLNVDTELDFDFFSIFAQSQDGVTEVFLNTSGVLDGPFEVDLSNFVGKDNVEIHFAFISDGSVVAGGVTVDDIVISSSTNEEE